MHARLLALACAVPAALAAPAATQCQLQALPTGIGVPSLGGPAYHAVSWDADGSGPAPAKVLVTGAFSLAGDAVTSGIAAFDPTAGQWSALPSLASLTNEIVVLPGGGLLARTLFTLDTWNGAAWVPFGAPLPSGTTTAVAIAANGDVLLATTNGGAASLHRFTGGAWQLLGSATGLFFSQTAIRALAIAPNGDIVAAGLFSAMNGVAMASLARWNGTSWSPLGAGVDGIVWALAFAANGDLFAGGWFPTAGGLAASNVARWNGASWSPLGSGTSHSFAPAGVVRALLVRGNGDLIAAGQFIAAGGIAVGRVARWDGTAWSAMGGGIDPVPLNGEESPIAYTLADVAGEVFVGGNFAVAGGRDAAGLARWNGSAWGPVLPTGIGRPVTAVHVKDNGDVLLGGLFRDVDGVQCNGIARRVGNTWQALGSGFGPSWFAMPRAFASDANGDLVVGGDFATAGGIASAGIARWNGASWLPLGSGLTGFSTLPPSVSAIDTAPNGDLWVAGTFVSAGGLAAEGVARWDGAAWSTLPPGLAAPGTGVSFLDEVAVMPNGDVVVAGWFDLGGPGQAKLARWNGTSWQLLGVFDNGVRVLLPLPNGDLLVGGTFSQVFNVQPLPGLVRWSNGSWFPVGNLGSPVNGTSVEDLVALPGGDLVAAGVLWFGSQFAGVARWDGATWTALASQPGPVFELEVDSRGELLIAGHFTSLASTASAYFGRYTTPCPATAVAAGAGCTGSGGANVLATTSLPWLGTVFTATATGMPGNGLALGVFGFGTASVPLASILPQGAPGCTLLATPDVLAAFVTSGAPLDLALPLPLVPALVGGVLHEQVVPLELGAGGAITSVTATNRLTLMLGAF